MALSRDHAPCGSGGQTWRSVICFFKVFLEIISFNIVRCLTLLHRGQLNKPKPRENVTGVTS